MRNSGLLAYLQTLSKSDLAWKSLEVIPSLVLQIGGN
uniref:Uncharacterized protein n=1 Tax=Rhizophora mucronata TaxID=61149 RepID=A0A2P2KJX4_RHIMU